VSFSSTAIATAIASLSITGVTVKDITAIPEGVSAESCPILFPSPDGWQMGGNGEPSDGPTTFGTPTTRMWTFNRGYKYIYLHTPVGTGQLADIIGPMSTKADAILTAFTTLDVTDVDVMKVEIGDFGALQGPDGHSFFGFTLNVIMRERLNN
jgi:hypothetical protein